MPPDTLVPVWLNPACVDVFPAAQDPAPKDWEIISMGIPAEVPRGDNDSPAVDSQDPTRRDTWATLQSRKDVLAFVKFCVFEAGGSRYFGYPRDNMGTLQELTKIGAPFVWGPAEQTAFTNLLLFRESRVNFPVCRF